MIKINLLNDRSRDWCKPVKVVPSLQRAFRELMIKEAYGLVDDLLVIIAAFAGIVVFICFWLIIWIPTAMAWALVYHTQKVMGVLLFVAGIWCWCWLLYTLITS